MEAARLQTCPVGGPGRRGEINNARCVALKHREGGLGERRAGGDGTAASTGTRARREGEERRANERFHAGGWHTLGEDVRNRAPPHTPAGSGSIYQVAKEQKRSGKMGATVSRPFFALVFCASE